MTQIYARPNHKIVVDIHFNPEKGQQRVLVHEILTQFTESKTKEEKRGVMRRVLLNSPSHDATVLTAMVGPVIDKVVRGYKETNSGNEMLGSLTDECEEAFMQLEAELAKFDEDTELALMEAEG